MIEITHRQARRLIREGIDRELAEEQWAVLQAHLEGCDACRAYVQHARGAERSLTRMLRDRWSARDLKGQQAADLGKKVIARRARRAVLRRWALRGLMGLGGVLALLAFITYQQISARARLPSPTPVVRLDRNPLVTPSPSGPTFTGRLVYSALNTEGDGPGSNVDLYLLNRAGVGAGSQGEITNLTNHPAHDVSPVWSPDGEWIAFLSNRGDAPDTAGKFELYVIQVAGTRLTRLTSDPEVQWSGPISWSANGRFLALTGERGSEGRRFVYLVPLSAQSGSDGSVDGPGARTLAFTGKALGPLRFSPTAALLAFAEDSLGSLLVYDQISTTFSSIDISGTVNEANLWESGPTQGSPWMAEGDFDWSPDGRQIAYLTYSSTEPGSSLPAVLLSSAETSPAHPDVGAAVPGVSSAPMLQQELRLSGVMFSGAAPRGGQEAAAEPLVTAPLGSLRSVTWLPARSRRVLAYLQREVGANFVGSATQTNDCWMVRLHALGVGTREIEDLCVESRLGPASWSEEGGWLVVSGRLPGESETALYALKIPTDLAMREAVVVERLGSAILSGPLILSGTLGESSSGSSPQVRPSPASSGPLVASAPPLRIRPDEAGGAPLGQSVPALPGPGTGDLFFSTSSLELGDMLVAQQPGQQRQILSRGVEQIICPTASRDGQQVAFITGSSPGFDGIRFGLNLFDRASGETRSLVDRAETPISQAEGRWSCPVWSPDGKWIAYTAFSSRGTTLVVASPDPEQTAHEIPLDVSYTVSSPAWTPDSRGLMVAVSPQARAPLRLLRVNPFATSPEGTEADGALVSNVVYETRGFDDVFSMAFAPTGADGPRDLAFVAADFLAGGGARLRLFGVNLDGSGLTMLSDLPDMEFQGWVGQTRLEWIPGRGLAVAIRQRPDALYKTEVWLYDTEKAMRRPLARLKEMAFYAAWSPDYRWMAYSSDSGLYLLELPPGDEGRSAPVQLTDEIITALDWK